MAESLYTRKIEMRQELMAFAVEMEMRLRENDYKVGWAAMSFVECLNRLHEETRELWELTWPFKRDDPPPSLTRAHRIQHEATDVANFSMFIYDNAGQEFLND